MCSLVQTAVAKSRPGLAACQNARGDGQKPILHRSGGDQRLRASVEKLRPPALLPLVVPREPAAFGQNPRLHRPLRPAVHLRPTGGAGRHPDNSAAARLEAAGSKVPAGNQAAPDFPAANREGGQREAEHPLPAAAAERRGRGRGAAEHRPVREEPDRRHRHWGVRDEALPALRVLAALRAAKVPIRLPNRAPDARRLLPPHQPQANSKKWNSTKTLTQLLTSRNSKK